jgi:hypothetical protein
MAEPLAKLGAGRDVLHPLIDGGTLLRDPTRPQPVDQDPSSVIRRWRLIGTLLV